jgi:hypothetical protein
MRCAEMSLSHHEGRCERYVPQVNAFAYSVAAMGQRFLVKKQVNTGRPRIESLLS